MKYGKINDFIFSIGLNNKQRNLSYLIQKSTEDAGFSMNTRVMDFDTITHSTFRKRTAACYCNL